MGRGEEDVRDHLVDCNLSKRLHGVLFVLTSSGQFQYPGESDFVDCFPGDLVDRVSVFRFLHLETHH